jgi:spore germination protein PD
MNLQVTNHEICVGSIRVIGVSSSSVLMIGDTKSIQMNSVFDTPSESLIFSPSVPIGTEG